VREATGSRLLRIATLATTAVALGLTGPGSAGAATFNVTTTADEYGENPGACGLREAVEAANMTSNFGGCTASDAFPADIIQLPATNYVLTRDGIDDDNEFGDLDVLNEPLGILGQASSGPTTIDGDGDDADPTDDRVLQVHPSVAAGPVEDFGATGLVIRNGRTPGFGGGISILGPLDGPPPGMGEEMVVGLSLNTFTDNRAEGGGAIYAESAEEVRVINSTLSGNDAVGPGGGVDAFGSATNPSLVRLENATVSANRADADATGTGSGGGISARGAGGGVAAYNTIIAGNVDLTPAGIVAPDCTGDGETISGGYNLIGSTANCDGMIAATGDVRDVDAQLAPLAPIPGAGLSTVLAHDLGSSSPARDAGNPAPAGGPLGTCEPLAQNFGPRPQGPRCDIGAVEADAAPPASGGDKPAVKKKCKKKKKRAAIAKKKKKCKKKKRKK
jgi:CSLREA domain-containing protein